MLIGSETLLNMSLLFNSYAALITRWHCPQAPKMASTLQYSNQIAYPPTPKNTSLLFKTGDVIVIFRWLTVLATDHSPRFALNILLMSSS
jgi:hypothetical protein